MAVTEKEAERIEYPSAGGKTAFGSPSPVVPLSVEESMCHFVAATSCPLVWKQSLASSRNWRGTRAQKMSKVSRNPVCIFPVSRPPSIKAGTGAFNFAHCFAPP